MSHPAITIRVPHPWAGRVSSQYVRVWLSSYGRNQGSLPPDPGPGPVRLSLALPRQPLGIVAARLGLSESEFLRRLIAQHLPVNTLPAENRSHNKTRWLWGLAAVLFLAVVGKPRG